MFSLQVEMISNHYLPKVAWILYHFPHKLARKFSQFSNKIQNFMTGGIAIFDFNLIDKYRTDITIRGLIRHKLII